MRLLRGLEDRGDTLPNVGLSVCKIHVGGVCLCFWDVGGQACVRKLWKQCYQEAECVLFIVDVTDDARQAEALDELRDLIDGRIPVVVLLNKTDMLETERRKKNLGEDDSALKHKLTNYRAKLRTLNVAVLLHGSLLRCAPQAASRLVHYVLNAQPPTAPDDQPLRTIPLDD